MKERIGAFSFLQICLQVRDLGQSKPRWEGNARIDLTERGVNMRNWIDSALVNAALHFQVP